MATSDHDDILDQVLSTPVEEEKKDTQTLAEA
jgi:hypothetical protein